MPEYLIEQYEIHVQKHVVEADNEADAIAKLFDGQAEPVDDSLEYVEVCEGRGLPAGEFPVLAEQVKALGKTIDGPLIPSIRSIEKVIES